MKSDDATGLVKVTLLPKARGTFLGAAIGDALGWPQENPWRRTDKRNVERERLPVDVFQRWVRKSGGRFYAHEEVILPGEYSDDTQLLLCTARSLLYGTTWWRHLTERELPTWILYERGGGGATKRAAEAWLARREPWSSTQESLKSQYFEAGGNGVAMRIMPHCLVGVGDSGFDKVAKNIVCNGVCTHGHPRALVGALAYGFALWSALRETGTLQYGSIIERLLCAVDSWSALPDFGDILPTWKRMAEAVSSSKYEEGWRGSVREMVQLLEQCREAMKQGALSVDQEALAQLGCFDERMKGSGTVAAAASIFLASRYAADPFHGVVEAAFAHGADTDTIASMTGGLLGAVAGNEWLGQYATQVQDAAYLRMVGERLVKDESNGKAELRATVTPSRSNFNSLVEKLEQSKQDDSILLPDGRKAQVFGHQRLETRSKTLLAISWKLTTVDGQSLYVKKVRRTSNVKGRDKGLSTCFPNKTTEAEFKPVEIVKSGVKLTVSDLARARFFYEKVLGLQVVRQSPASVNFGDVIALVAPETRTRATQRRRTLNSNGNFVVYIETRSLEAACDNARKFGSTIITPITNAHGQRFFRCVDPDGNVVQLSERTQATF